MNKSSTKIFNNSLSKSNNTSNSAVLSSIPNSKNYQRTKSIIVDKLGVEEAEIVPTANFLNDLGADSLDLV